MVQQKNKNKTLYASITFSEKMQNYKNINLGALIWLIAILFQSTKKN